MGDMLATASAQVCVPLGHSSLYFIFVFAARRLMTISLVTDITLKSSQVVYD